MSRISVAILAGGRSRRLGTDKALVRLLPDDPPLLAIVQQGVQLLTDDLFVVASGRPEYESIGAPVRPDLYPDAGVLGGIGSALRHARYDACLVVSCDHPFLSTPLLETIVAKHVDADITVPTISGASRQGGNVIRQTLHAVYGRSCVQPIERAIKQGSFQIVGFFEHVRVNEVDTEPLRQFDPELWSFFSVNTPEALEIARRRRAESLAQGAVDRRGTPSTILAHRNYDFGTDSIWGNSVRTTSSTQKGKGRSTSRQRGNQSGARVNRAQVRAMEARATAAPAERATTAFASDSADVAVLRRGALAVAVRGQAVRAKTLTREEEYAYIRDDMHRLVIIAGGLFLVMIVLLFLID